MIKKMPRHRAGHRFLRKERSAAVILVEVIDDRLGIAVVDWRAKRLDHFRYLGVPARRFEKRRVHLDIVEAVARGTVAFDLVEAVGLFESDFAFVGQCRCRDENGERGDENVSHDVLLQTPVTATAAYRL